MAGEKGKKPISNSPKQASSGEMGLFFILKEGKTEYAEACQDHEVSSGLGQDIQQAFFDKGASVLGPKRSQRAAEVASHIPGGCQGAGTWGIDREAEARVWHQSWLCGCANCAVVRGPEFRRAHTWFNAWFYALHPPS